jgi:hypothetical protein
MKRRRYRHRHQDAVVALPQYEAPVNAHLEGATNPRSTQVVLVCTPDGGEGQVDGFPSRCSPRHTCRSAIVSYTSRDY